MSCFNETEKELSESIDSILTQTLQDFEFIIVDDNPTNDEIKKILLSYKKDKRIKLIFNDRNIGLAKSLNKAIEIATGKYIARMDADDISLAERLEKQVNYLETHDDCSMVATNRDDINENSEVIKENAAIVVSDNLLQKVTKYGSIITHPSVMIRTKLLKSLGGYRAFPSAQDYDLWLRMLSSKQKIHIMPEVLLRYRIRQKSITKSNPAKQYFCNYYAQKLFKERLKKGYDTFSLEYLLNLINSDKVTNTALKDQYDLIHSLKKQNLRSKIYSIQKIFKDCARFPHNRRNIINLYFVKFYLLLQKLS